VIRSGSTTLATAQKACREFGESRLLGVVLNGVSPNPADSSSYYEKAKARNPEAC